MNSSNSSKDKKPTSAPEVVLKMSKITEDILIGTNYSNWSKTIRLYLWSIPMASHLDKDPPTNYSKDRWLEDDAVSSYKFVIPLTVKYSPSLITMSMLRN